MEKRGVNVEISEVLSTFKRSLERLQEAKTSLETAEIEYRNAQEDVLCVLRAVGQPVLDLDEVFTLEGAKIVIRKVVRTYDRKYVEI